MDYELYEELKTLVNRALDEKKNPKEVLKTISELINHIADDYLKD